MSIHYLSDEEKRRLLDYYTSDAEWKELFETAKRNIEEQYAQFLAEFDDERPASWHGTSPLTLLAEFPRNRLGPWPRGIPRQEVNLSPEAMQRLSALSIITREETLERYGTSGDLDPRGYWMPIDGDAS